MSPCAPPAGWSSLWLNEGFATKTEYVGVDEAEPQFEISRQYTSTAMYAALRADALAERAGADRRG